jgi:hypothetical protein
MSTTQAARVARIAWLMAFVVPLILVALLLGVESAHAAPLPAVAAADFEEFEAEENEEEGESEENGCQEAEGEFEEGELSKLEVEEICEEAEEQNRKKASDPGGDAPEECILRSAHAHAATPGKGNKLKITIGYTTYEPVAATVEVGDIATVHRHLRRSGVLRIVESLARGQSPTQIVVRIHLPASPRYCGKYQTQEVQVH